MRALKSCLVAGIVVAVLGAGLAGSATAADQVEPPLRVKISNFYATQKIKVAKKLKIAVSCNRACAIKVKGSLRMPVGKAGWKASRDLDTGGIWFLTYRLSNVGLKYLRQHYKKSRYVITATATDLESGKKATKTRNFRFRKK